VVSHTNQPANNNVDVSQLSVGVYIAEVKVEGFVKRVRWAKM
jgi:hypothetical protein